MGDPLLPGPSPLLTQHRHTFHKLSQTCSRVTRDSYSKMVEERKLERIICHQDPPSPGDP